MGILSGLYKSEATVEFFDSHAQVRQGDTVITSGLSSRFPANIAVGKVSQPPNRQAEPFQVTVRFTAPLDGLQWVLVYPEVASQGLDVPQP
jgi:rod shape-determining protein MreC